MIDDILTVIWKELREFISQGGRGRLGRISMIMAFLPGLVIPLQFGRDWVVTPIALVTLGLIPLIVLTIIADAIAGERERHTLETLLASRLSDRAILYGKIGAATLYVMAQLLVFTIPALVIVNIVFFNDGPVIYPPAVLLGIFLVGPLLAIFASSIGVLISMRSATVRQAQLVLMAIMFLSFMIVPIVLAVVAVLLVLVVSTLVSSVTLDSMRDTIRESGVIIGVLVALAVLIVADMSLLSFLETRFRRTRLIVD